MNFTPSLGNITPSSAWLPLLYDSCVLILTLFKTVPEAFKDRRITMRVFQDGVIYHVAILTVNLVIISTGPSDTLTSVTSKWIAFAHYGRLELLIPVAMTSRITLNLKKSGSRTRTTLSGSGLSIVSASNSQARTTHNTSTGYIVPDAEPTHTD
ncbi:hypothetical protein C8R45DRAFT_1135790 [Mycena sanguinolenta]|nr:hypothetical protein C8R45DRAFT_1135790 [Mycena sanguinolenta]